LSFWNQLNAAAGSVMDNIAEGFDRFSRAEFKQFLIIARGSNAETRSQLYRIRDRRYFSDAYCDTLIQTSTNLSVRITNLINHLLQSEYTHKPIPTKPGNVNDPQIPYVNPFELEIPEEDIIQYNSRN
jgi:four helix bundle protein